MTQYSSVNEKLCSSQFEKLKSAIKKNETRVTWKLSSYMTGESSNEVKFKALQSFFEWFISWYRIIKNSDI